MSCSTYVSVSLLLTVGLVMGAALMALAYFVSPLRLLESEKLSAYECGFDPFSSCRNEVPIHFYLLGMLFVVFDLEIILMLPWATSAGSMPLLSSWSVLDFLLELTVGFAYAWLSDSLSLKNNHQLKRS